MGCDGGTIPRRDELVRTKKKPETKDKDSEMMFEWRCCALTQQPLQTPIVICGLGKLYNKVSLIEALLNKNSISPDISHIKSLKDIRELNLTPNPNFEDDDTKDRGSNIGPAPFLCPVIGLEMSGKFRFIALWSCGCVFSERALKQIETNICHKCDKPFDSEDVIIINGNEEDISLMKERMEKRQLKLKKKKEKKIKTEPLEEIKTEDSTEDDVKEIKIAAINPKAGPLNSGKRSGKLHESTMDTKKMKCDYSVSRDPKATDVYKSIFTTHESEREQNRAHWVTYNPFYN